MVIAAPTRETVLHLHLVSDSTGETVNTIARAACAQFATIRTREHIHALVRNQRQLQRALKAIQDHPGVVIFSVVNGELRQELETFCRETKTPCIAALDPILTVLRVYLGLEESHRPGGQHDMDAGYFRRIEAMNYSMAHDDGQHTDDLELADVVLVGVSRTSKTPTSIYLANRGIRTANIPIVAGRPLPPNLETLTQPLVVGLTASPERLVQIRKNRLLSLKETTETEYVSVESVREEIIDARKLFSRNSWPVIDVSRRSIEETAAAILNLYQEHKGGEGIEL